MNGVKAAVAAAIGAALDADPRLVVVASLADPLVGPVLATRRGRLVTALGPGSRVHIAEGLAGAGRPVVVSLHGDEPPAEVSGRVVVLTDSVEQAAVAHAGGATVVQPVWSTDADDLVRLALTIDGPVVVRSHSTSPDPGESAPPPPADNGPRLLQRGDGGLVVGAGAAVHLLAVAARMAAGRGVELTAVDLHTATPGDGLDVRRCDDHVWVGPAPDDLADLGDTGQLAAVSIAGASARQVMDAVLSGLPQG